MRARLAALLLAGIVLVAGLWWSTSGGTDVAGGATVDRPQVTQAPSRERSANPSPSPTRSPRPSSSPTPLPTGPPAHAHTGAIADYGALRASLESLLDNPNAQLEAVLGIAVLDRSGTAVLDVHGDEPLLPASAQKLVTAAGALAQLGAGHRFTTRAVAAGPIGADGTLSGDLILVGGGDPVLASPVFITEIQPDRPHTPLDALADQIVAAGVRRVTGGVIGDGTVFADERLPAGWLPEYLSRFDGVRTGGLTVDAGRTLAIRGGRVVANPAENPTLQAAVELLVLLNQRGVTVNGGAGTGSAPDNASELGRVESPPLRDLLAFLVQTSDNQLADGIFRSVGAVGGDPTWAGSAAVIRETLAPLGLDWSGIVLADGSGLSRDDRLSARFLARLYLEMSASELADEWEPLMAVAGQSGTLRRRLVGTVGEGRLRGKTGTLRDVRSLAGAVVGPDDARYYFAVLGNELAGEGPGAVRALQDELVLLLAEDLYGCIRVEVPAPPPADPAATPPPATIELQCAA